MKDWFSQFLNLIFPPRCEVCRSFSNEALCTTCFQQIKFAKPKMGIYSVAAYEGVMRTAIQRLKFKKKKKLVEPLGVLMIEYLKHMPGLELKELDVIIPVPLHPNRLHGRGFNQAEILAQYVQRYYEIPVASSALERTRDTKPQFDLPLKERKKNIADAFRVKALGEVFGKNILMVDDIYTTGSTIAECCRVLKNAGAKKVEVLTLSRAVEI